ncbi:hypothetical protein KUCAC02_035648 [Chaenocephalus aceratus]|nr:hypothetical protein KUCAC02_035648 [Chaenocephalus aceratus]
METKGVKTTKSHRHIRGRRCSRWSSAAAGYLGMFLLLLLRVLLLRYRLHA